MELGVRAPLKNHLQHCTYKFLHTPNGWTTHIPWIESPNILLPTPNPKDCRQSKNMQSMLQVSKACFGM